MNNTIQQKSGTGVQKRRGNKGEDLKPLTTSKKKQLDRAEEIIREKIGAFVEVGQALARIRDDELYRGTHRTFDAYCLEMWNLSHAHAYRLIDAADTAENLASLGDKVQTLNESQLRPLAGVDEKLQMKIVKLAFKKSPQLTAKTVTEAKLEVIGPAEGKKRPRKGAGHNGKSLVGVLQKALTQIANIRKEVVRDHGADHILKHLDGLRVTVKGAHKTAQAKH